MEAIAEGGVFSIASRGYGGSTMRLQVTQPAGGSGWLFGGGVVFQRRAEGGWAYRVELQLNPMRFFCHRAEAYRTHHGENLSSDLLRWNRRARLSAMEETLDGSDNFLSTSRARSAALTDWADFTTFYIRAVAALVEEQLMLADPTGSRLHLTWAGWTARHVESAWEFDQLDARHSSDMIAGGFRSVPGSARTSHASSSSLTLPVGKNMMVAIYPKTATRLRIELRHTKNIRGIYQRLARRTAFPNRDLGDVAPFLSFLHEKAAERLNRLFALTVLPEAMVSLDTPTALVGFLNAIRRRTTNSDFAFGWIISQLLEHGRIAEERWRPMRAECEDLVQDQILIRRRSAQRERYRTYTVHPRYQSLLDRLRTMLRGTAPGT